MTAPTLTPAEQAEVTRFGAHDEEILRDLAEHANEVIPCEVEGNPAVWRLATRCCGSAIFVCQPCRDDVVEGLPAELAQQPWLCLACEHIFAQGSLYADVMREVQL